MARTFDESAPTPTTAWTLLRPASDQLRRCLELLPPSSPFQALPGTETREAQDDRQDFGKGALCSLPFRLLTTCQTPPRKLGDSLWTHASAGSRRFIGFASSGPSGRRLKRDDHGKTPLQP